MFDPALIAYALALADDALVLGHRLSEWSGKAPSLEEDIALSNLGLDLIGQARLFYQLAARLEDKGDRSLALQLPTAQPRNEDKLAYFRDAPEFRNVLLVELPRGDFAFTMARQFVVSASLHPYYAALAQTHEPDFAGIAAKAVKEMAYHVRHSSEWVIRLGDGTEESHRRMVTALTAIWPYVDELFEMDAHERQLVAAGIAPDRASIKATWDATIDRVLAEAKLERPLLTAVEMKTGGRAGYHTGHLAALLGDMQSLARAHPGATW